MIIAIVSMSASGILATVVATQGHPCFVTAYGDSEASPMIAQFYVVGGLGTLITGFVIGLLTHGSRLARRAVLVSAVILSLTDTILVMLMSMNALDAQQVADDVGVFGIGAIVLLILLSLGFWLGGVTRRSRRGTSPPGRRTMIETARLQVGQRVRIGYRDRSSHSGVRGEVLRVGPDDVVVHSAKSGRRVRVAFDNIAEIEPLGALAGSWAAPSPAPDADRPATDPETPGDTGADQWMRHPSNTTGEASIPTIRWLLGAALGGLSGLLSMMLLGGLLGADPLPFGSAFVIGSVVVTVVTVVGLVIEAQTLRRWLGASFVAFAVLAVEVLLIAWILGRF